MYIYIFIFIYIYTYIYIYIYIYTHITIPHMKVYLTPPFWRTPFFVASKAVLNLFEIH